MILGKKARKEAARREKAIRRMRLINFVSLLAPVIFGWQMGVKGGGEVSGFPIPAIETSDKERRYILMQMGRVDKAHEDMMNALGAENFDPEKQRFYKDLEDRFQFLRKHIADVLPKTYSAKDALIVCTYIVYTSLYDYAALESDDRPQLRKLVQVLGQLANHLLPAGSPLCGPMNAVYWATRDDLQAHPDWTRGGTLEWLPSDDERAMGLA